MSHVCGISMLLPECMNTDFLDVQGMSLRFSIIQRMSGILTLFCGMRQPEFQVVYGNLPKLSLPSVDKRAFFKAVNLHSLTALSFRPVTVVIHWDNVMDKENLNHISLQSTA